LVGLGRRWRAVQVQYVDVVRDIGRELGGQHPGAANTTSQFAWYWRQRYNRFSRLLWPRKNVCSRATAAASPLSPDAAAGHAAAAVKTTAAEGLWGTPKFDCTRARSWTVAFSVPFFGCTPAREHAFK